MKEKKVFSMREYGHLKEYGIFWGFLKANLKKTTRKIGNAFYMHVEFDFSKNKVMVAVNPNIYGDRGQKRFL